MRTENDAIVIDIFRPKEQQLFNAILRELARFSKEQIKRG